MKPQPQRGPAQVPEFNLTAFRDEGYLQEINALAYREAHLSFGIRPL
jgi:hypothetical protein